MTSILITDAENRSALAATRSLSRKGCRVVVDFLRVWERNTSFDVLDRRDLGPFLFEARNYLKGS